MTTWNPQKYLLRGICGSLLLLALYFFVLTFANSFSHAREEFKLLWYWVLALAIGFGAQIGLYSHLRDLRSAKKNGTGLAMAGSTGVSAVSMAACCAHHLVDVLPVLGLSAATIFLIQYQSYFLALGLASNIASIAYMAKIIKKYKAKI